MGSIDKLKRLTGENIKPPEGGSRRVDEAKRIHTSSSEKQSQLDELRRRIDDVMSRGREKDQLAVNRKINPARDNLKEFVSGEEIENDSGKFFLVSDVVRGSYPYGYRNISAMRLRSFPVPVPMLEEQVEINASMDAVVKKIELQKEKKILLEELFRTLLHRLMTGQTRVNDIDLPGLF